MKSPILRTGEGRISEQNVEIVRAAFEAWNAGDMDAVRERIDPDANIARGLEGWPEGSEATVGREAIFALSNNSVPAFYNYTDAYSRDRDFTSPKVSAYCASIGKPWVTEEFGISQFHSDAERAGWYQTIYDIQRDYGSKVLISGTSEVS